MLCKTEKKNRILTLVFCAVIPAAIMYLIYAVRGEHPFGDGCVLVLDLNAQYVWFFDAVRNFVKGDASLLYSFSRQLGGEFLGIYAYYAASPLTYLLCLFPQNRMLEALMAMFLVKTGLCGVTFGYYMQKSEGKIRGYAVIPFAVMYALSAYGVVQQNNTMWIDAMICLPLITLGMDELIRHGRFKCYTFFLFLGVFSNFYIGYMLCIYCAFYFFIAYFREGKANNPMGEKAHFIKSLLRVIFYSVLALGMAAVILVAAYYSLNFGKTSFSNPTYAFEANFSWRAFLAKLLPGSYDTVRPEGLPFIYSGVLTLLLIPMYFLSRKYTVRRKIFSVLLLAFFVLSMSFSLPDIIWHGFQKPNWLNYRYAFMFCFWLCVLASRGMSDFKKTPFQVILGGALLIGGFAFYMQGYAYGDYLKLDTYATILYTIGAVIVYVIVLAFLRRFESKRIVAVVLCLLVSGEAFASGLLNINALDDDVTYSHYSYYNDFLNSARPLVEEVQASDTSFYRMEKTYFRKINDNMALNIHGLSGSSSTLNKETIRFLQSFGYASKSHWSKYLGGNPVNDSLLGLKYILTDTNPYADYYETYLVDEENGHTAYYNPYALSLAYGVNDDIYDVLMGFAEGEALGEDASAVKKFVQNVKSTLNDFLGINETPSGSWQDGYVSPYARLNGIITAMLGETTEVFKPIAVSDTKLVNLREGFFGGGEHGYTAKNEDDTGYYTMTFTVPEDGEVFFYLPTNYPREVKLQLMSSVTGSYKSYGTFNGSETARSISLGNHEAGEKLTLKVTLTTEWVYFLYGEPCIYYLDKIAFTDAMRRLAGGNVVINDYTDDHLVGTYTATKTNETILTTIAYDEGWKITVNGESVTPKKALGALIAFDFDATVGETYTVEMTYNPDYLVVTVALSSLAWAVFTTLALTTAFLPDTPVVRLFATIKKKKED